MTLFYLVALQRCVKEKTVPWKRTIRGRAFGAILARNVDLKEQCPCCLASGSRTAVSVGGRAGLGSTFRTRIA